MRVLVIGSYYRGALAHFIAEVLERMGHQTCRYEADPALSWKPQGRLMRSAYRALRRAKKVYRELPFSLRAIEREIFDAVGDNDLDLILVCHDFLWPQTARALKQRYDAPIALWFPDAVINFGKCMFLNACYDALFFKEPYVIDVLRNELGKNAFYLPECCDPATHQTITLTPAEQEKFGCELGTAGNFHAARAAFFAHLDRYHIKLWGNPPAWWMEVPRADEIFQRQVVAGRDKAAAYLGAKIVINSLHPTEVFGLNSRAFEVAGVGGFQLLSWRPSLAQLFNEGEEIVAFRSIGEFIEKADYYLEHEDQRLQIAKRGQQRAYRDHTYEKRLELLIDAVFNGGQGFPLLQYTKTP